jgi:hypothetical protein
VIDADSSLGIVLNCNIIITKLRTMRTDITVLYVDVEHHGIFFSIKFLFQGVTCSQRQNIHDLLRIRCVL